MNDSQPITAKKLFHMLAPYMYKKYYAGRLVRWLIGDKQGRSVYCTFCGNIANGVGLLRYKRTDFSLVMCNKHLEMNMTETDEIYSAGVITIVLKGDNKEAVAADKKRISLSDPELTKIVVDALNKMTQPQRERIVLTLLGN